MTDTWELGFSDPTVMGWLVCCAYFVVSVGCFRNTLGSGNAGRLASVLWLLLGLSLMFLAFNKQLDIQTLLKEQFRGLAAEQGWYERRRLFYGIALSVTSVGIAAVAGAIVLKLPRAERRLRQVSICFAGLSVALLLQFLPFKAVSRSLEFTFFIERADLWHFDVVELVELGLLSMIGIGAFREN